MTKTYETDVAIIGAGAAGIAAGIDARDAGARVIVFEKAADPGGSAITSGGGCCMVGTPLQKQEGIEDNPDLAFNDWMTWGGPAADAVWARYYIEHTLHDLYHWAESHDVKWIDFKSQEGNSVDRWTRPEGNGLGLMTRLLEAYRKRDGQLVANTAISGVTMDGGRAVGLTGKNTETGEAVGIKARTIIVTSGGFNANVDMVKEVMPWLEDDRIMEGSGRGSTGDGHKMLRQLGAYFTHLDQVWFYVYATPDYRDPAGRRGLAFRQMPGYVWVNQQGHRFHNEALSGGNSAAPALLAQTPRHAWAIADRPMTATLEIADPYYRRGDKVDREKVEELLDNSPFIKKADTLEGLAQQIGVDTAAFRDAIERYNSAFDKGLANEPEFGKPLNSSKKFDTAPYYAIQIFPLARKNFGGVKTDIRCRVMDKHFEPIPGLYAAGEVAGMAGGHINGKAGLEGTMLGPSLFSGRVAGAWAAQEAGHGAGFKGKPNR